MLVKCDDQVEDESAWGERKAAWFEPVSDGEFDWEAFDSGSTKREPKVNATSV